MPFRATFDCLWCGDPWTVRAPGDLEGWALLCGPCLGRAGSNAFLRGRLRTALAERAAASPESASARPVPAPASPSRTAPRAGPSNVAFPDDWFLRRGPYERGTIHDTAWAAEIDMVTRWLDDLPPAARIAEPAAGVGFFSPLLAARGELHASDRDGEALDRARERLLAHRLLAHLHVADPWSIPAGDPFDQVVAAFLLGRVRGAGLDAAAASLRARLRPGGTLALIDLHPDPAGGPPDGVAWSWHEPVVLEAALTRAGFEAVRLAATGRFFLLGTALAA
jgi:SAM-dependent methyltransferase